MNWQELHDSSQSHKDQGEPDFLARPTRRPDVLNLRARFSVFPLDPRSLPSLTQTQLSQS